MATQLNWRPDGGIVAWVQEDRLPKYDLPPEATRIQQDGKPAFHVTLIGSSALPPYRDAMAAVWPAVLDAAPEPPEVELSPEAGRAHDEVKNKTSWYACVLNPDAYREYLRSLVHLIDQEMRAAGKGAFEPDFHRRFHVTIANDKGGDPMASVSEPPPHSCD